MHYTVRVPVGGLAEFLSAVRDGRWRGGPGGAGAAGHLADGLMLGSEVAGWFAGWRAGLARPAAQVPGTGAGPGVPGFAAGMLAGDADVSVIRGYLALVYTQAAAVLQRRLAGPGADVVITDYLAAAALTPLGEIRAGLAEPVRGFLAGNAAGISRRVLEYFRGRTGAGAGLSGMVVHDGRSTVGEYLAGALAPRSPGRVILQPQALGVTLPGASGPDGGPGVVVVELRAYRVGLAALRANFGELEAAVAAARAAADRVGQAAGPAGDEMGVVARLGGSPDQRVREVLTVLESAWRLDPVLAGLADGEPVLPAAVVSAVLGGLDGVISGAPPPGAAQAVIGGLGQVAAALGRAARRFPQVPGDPGYAGRAAAAAGQVREIAVSLGRAAARSPAVSADAGPAGITRRAVIGRLEAGLGTGPGSSGEILRSLRAAVRPARAGAEAGGTALLGPDLFGLRQTPPAPPFLAGVDQGQVGTGQLVRFFEILDMARVSHPDDDLFEAPDLAPARSPAGSGPPASADLDPGRLPADEGSVWRAHLDPGERSWPRSSGRNLQDLPPDLEMPLLFHSIWLGSPLTDTQFRDNLKLLADQARPAWRVLVWTDIPRATFAEAARSPADGPLSAVREMRAWARRHGLLLINVDEVFHARAPMPLAEFYRMERAKRIGVGFAAASDILRLAILDRFGGLYSDGDNKLVSLDGLQDVFSQLGFAVHSPAPGADQMNNSVLLAARRHPYPRRALDAIERNYALTQADLLGPQVVRRQTRADNVAWVTEPAQIIRRNSVLQRTGPAAHADVALAVWAASSRGYCTVLPVVTPEQLTMGDGNSWIPQSPLAPPRRYGQEEVAEVTRDVAATLIRELENRDGDLHLTYVAPVISGLPDPAAAWRAVITFILSQPGLHPITTVTDRALYHEPPWRLTTLVVSLPDDVRAALSISDDHVPPGQRPPGTWRLAELMRPVSLPR